MTSTNTLPHSAEYLKDSRDFWWNLDFLKLISKRLGLDQVSTVLDIGHGIGHFGQILASVLPEKTNLIGVDREKFWVQKATERALKVGLADRYRYQQEDANYLPFTDENHTCIMSSRYQYAEKKNTQKDNNCYDSFFIKDILRRCRTIVDNIRISF